LFVRDFIDLGPVYSPRVSMVQAAILASYSEKTAQVIGAENLKKPEIQAAIRAGYSEKTANEQGARLLANVSQSCRMMGPP
jgi:phage terminase small subunit